MKIKFLGAARTVTSTPEAMSDNTKTAAPRLTTLVQGGG